MATASGHRMEQSTGMGPRKTLIIMVTVVGCVAILWPKVFYPMMVGNGQNKNVIKDHRGAGCCGVVLDQETFANASISYADQQKQQQQQQQQQNLFRKRSYAPFVEIESIRQERPPHLRPEAMHPAMRERGRAIPQAGSVHGGERPHTPPRIVEGRPGPIPGMRPPMGAGSHQATKSANSMGFIMPLYTIGIVSFFIYTIMKLIFKKTPATPYAEVKPDPAFRNEVFTTTEPYIKRPDDGTTKLGQSVSASTSVTNAELVAPVTSSASAVDTAPVAHTSVQSELSHDYEQLAASQPLQEQYHQKASNDDAKPEANLANGLNGPAEEQEIEKIAAVTAFKDEQSPHDPTTEKVVDGIVVKKVVSFEEVSAGSDRVLEAEQGYDVPDSVSVVTEEEIVVQRAVEQTAAIPPLEMQLPCAEPFVSSEEVPIEDVKPIDEPIETVADETEVPSITEQPAEISATSEAANESAEIATEPTSELITFEEPAQEVIVNEIVQEESPTTVLERSNEEQQQAVVEDTVEATQPVDEVVEETITKTPEEATITVEEEIVAALKEENESTQPEIRAEDESAATIEQNKDTSELQAPVEEVLVSKDLQSGLLADALREEETTDVHVKVQESTAAANVVSADDYPDLVMDNEMAIRVNETVEDITHAAEQLVCEVLEKAEELAKQQEEGEQQYPELPTYDPGTQKLVDGIVIERFDAEVTKDTENAATSSFSVAAACESQAESASVELLDVADRVNHFVPEDDGADVDSISEDTSLSVASVIEQQPLVKEGMEEATTLPEAMITTELLVDRTSSEPVIVDGSDQPTVETENVLEPEHPAEPTEAGQQPETSNRKSVSIEEVHDDAPITDHTEGKVIEEHIIPISIEKEESATGAMTITEVSADEPFVESPHDSKTASTLSSPLVTAVPVMDVIDEQQEQASEHQDNQDTAAVSEETLEHVTKEALVERTLNEAAAVVNEIESIVDHIITEKLIQSGGVPDVRDADTLPGGPPRLAASAALVVEAIESKTAASASVQSMIASSSDSNQDTTISTTPSVTSEPIAAPPSTVITNGLTNLNGGTICDTNQPTPDVSLASESSTSTITASLDASFPIPVIKSPAAIPESEDSQVPQHAIAPASTSETQSIHFAADPPASKSISATATTTENGVAATGNGSTGSYVVPEEREIERHTAPAAAATAATAASTSIGQVPTSVSNVTNPKFFTLNLANYSTSNNSSGNNSNRSSFSIPNLSQSQVALPVGGGDSADQLMELELLRKKLDETERAMTKIIANMGNIPKGQETNVTTEEATAASSEQQEQATEEEKQQQETIVKDGTDTDKEQSQQPATTNGHAIKPIDDAVTGAELTPETRQSKSKRDRSTERGTVKVMAMEVTAQRENGKRLSRPTTPLLPMGHAETTTAGTSGTEEHETRSILLDGRLPHDSKILVADAETAVEKLEPENSEEEEEDAPVILSGKMTLSLINMDFIEKDATGSVAVGEIVTELHKPQEEITTGVVASKGGD